MRASTESGGSDRLQCSQLGLNSSMDPRLAPTVSLLEQDSRAAELFRKVLDLRQAVKHTQLRLLVVHVHGRLERQVGYDRRVHVDEPQAGVLVADVATALQAPLAEA